MDDLYVIELEPEVRSWLELLPDSQHRKVEEYAELLATLGTRTPMPFARPLEEGVYELRPTLGGANTRITYWFMHESAQVARAVAARKLCASEHGPAHTTYSRGEERETR